VHDSVIVLITENAPETEDYIFNNGIHMMNEGNIEYVDTLMNVIKCKLRSLLYDTILIYPGQDNFELLHWYNPHDKCSYLLNIGDTLLISYINHRVPYAKILNREYNENELNYDYMFMNHIHKSDSISAYGTFSDPVLYANYESPIKDQIPLIKAIAEKTLRKEIKEELIYLDSLKKEQLISEEHYKYRKNNVLSIIYRSKTDSIPDNNIFSSDSLFTTYGSLSHFYFYRILLHRHINSFRIPQNQRTKLTPSDEQLIFDNIINSNNYSNLIKRQVFKIIANEMKKKVSTKGFDKMLSDYQNITQDSLTYLTIKEQFGLLIPDSLEVSLENKEGKLSTLSEVINRHKGTYVYVDFWATWCIPCRALLPDNARLEKEYHDKNIVFVSLAFNDDEKKWKEFLSENSNLFGTENYIITNTKSSRIIEGWDIKAIPRYMLFDEKGNIAILDAPRPNTKEIRNVLNKLLK
jgi:thiol-disulfide isomerase/thioredoxin